MDAPKLDTVSLRASPHYCLCEKEDSLLSGTVAATVTLKLLFSAELGCTWSPSKGENLLATGPSEGVTVLEVIDGPAQEL